MEIFASKIVALINRTAPRDLYDIHNLLELGLFDESEQDFINQFGKGYYMPELLFDGDILGNIKEHPMAKWKCEKTRKKCSK